MSSSGSSPEPEPVKAKRAKKKTKISKPVAANPDGKDEGTNPEWDYVPPEDTVLLDHDVDSGDFDWDAVKDNDDLELWLVRVPDSVKPKYLENLKIDLPSSSRSETVGVLKRKTVSYDIWAIGDGEEQPIGGEEIRGLSCLLPRKKKKGRLFQAPKPIARHLVLSAQDVLPGSSDSNQKYQNPPRQSYPQNVLTHAFTPFGSNTAEDAEAGVKPDAMEVDEGGSRAEDVHGEASSPSKKPKSKKRKVEGESPKKSKKVKVDAA
ncbi:hypothetical protein FIBSPDRAFT_1049185 [Athelia psychrophila]|uniref:Uncharacterized protein n=1 Tax=Athelia psychrophila TaxID=1759441 RepID=A0A166CM76_9AGAM|nr:hypothetical protein FIBSPDRAFT_1049185 [Fibularhizoctonia sp. CBS 109695]